MSFGKGSISTSLITEDAPLRESLTQIIRGLTPNAALREDLLQEAWIHLWLTETRRPGQTKSWYLQSAKFHVLHYLTSGRSVDSRKRWRCYSHFESDCVLPEELSDQVDPDDSVLSQLV